MQLQEGISGEGENRKKKTLVGSQRMDHTKTLLRNFETAKIQLYLDLSKSQLHLLFGSLAGHYRLMNHLMRMGVSRSLAEAVPASGFNQKSGTERQMSRVWWKLLC